MPYTREGTGYRLVLRTAIARAHARYRLTLWIEDDGISEVGCLTRLVELLFHPAMDAVASSQPAPSGDGLQTCGKHCGIAAKSCSAAVGRTKILMRKTVSMSWSVR